MMEVSGSDGGWENDTNNLPVRVSFTVCMGMQMQTQRKMVQMPQIPMNSGGG
jgi:hypothetical protein